jgi:hypothetical protein
MAPPGPSPVPSSPPVLLPIPVLASHAEACLPLPHAIHMGPESTVRPDTAQAPARRGEANKHNLCPSLNTRLRHLSLVKQPALVIVACSATAKPSRHDAFHPARSRCQRRATSEIAIPLSSIGWRSPSPSSRSDNAQPKAEMIRANRSVRVYKHRSIGRDIGEVDQKGSSAIGTFPALLSGVKAGYPITARSKLSRHV